MTRMLHSQRGVRQFYSVRSCFLSDVVVRRDACLDTIKWSQSGIRCKFNDTIIVVLASLMDCMCVDHH